MELLHQLFVAFSLLQKMQILTLQVFNQRNFRNLLRSICLLYTSDAADEL